MSVPGADREKAARVVAREMNALMGDLSGRDDTTASDYTMVDALIAAGWGPGGAPARPTREALGRVLFSQWLGKPVEDEHWTRVDADKGEQWHIAMHRADALLAADHLWTEQPTDRRALIDGLRVAMLGTTDGDLIDGNSEIPAGEMFRLAAEYLESTQLPSAPVVDREALALAIHAAQTKHSGFVQTTGFWLGAVDTVLTSGVLRDAADVWDEGQAAYETTRVNPYRSTGGSR